MKINNQSHTLRVIKSIFNFRQWLDYDRLRAFTLYLGLGIKKMFIPQKEQVSDQANSFNDMLVKLNLTEGDLIERRKGLYRLSILMCVLAFAIAGYGIYHLVYGNYRAAIVSIIMAFVGIVLAFRYHFWYFQIRKRQLGCSFKEWYKQGLLGKKP